MSKELLRELPSVDQLLAQPAVNDLLGRLPRELVVAAIRTTLDDRRTVLLGGRGDAGTVAVAGIVEGILGEVTAQLDPRLKPVINGTGVVLHTNLGRAPLSREIVAEASEVACGYSNLEYDLAARRRGSRYSHAAALLKELTGAEDSLVVNNNAGAMVLLLMALAKDREVIVSRGEMIEIGGSFRLPDIMATSGAQMVEVGTTNRTHLKDYASAITDRTAMMMKVHRSNFAIVGFTKEVNGEDLSALGREQGVVTCEDLGSGALVDLSAYGIPTTTAAQQVASGLDLVTFSGDKMLGGPQAGIIVGRGDLIARIRTHPLTRAMRVDKLTLATLERTLIAYRDGSWNERIPALAFLTADEATLAAKAERLATRIREELGDKASVTTEPTLGRVGGGALPETELKGFGVRVRFTNTRGLAVDKALRDGSPAVVCRIDDDALVFDVRTIFDEQLELIAVRLGRILAV